MSETEIVIRGAREHNLRNINLALPRNKLIVMTGVSGSGKSSLAFDTLYAEGQRRYVESLSTYARQFMGQLPKPNVDSINGLAPSISIQQKSTSRNPRSTVGTITEIFDYLRVLFARVGQGYCYVSGKPIKAQSTDSIIDSIASLEDGTRYSILAPIVQNQKGEFKDLFEDLLKRGHLRARVDGEVVSLSEDLNLRRHHKHSIEVVVDRLVAGPSNRGRLAEAVELALKLADGRLICAVEADGPTASTAASESKAGTTKTAKHSRKNQDEIPSGRREPSSDRLYSANYACAESGMSYEPPSPQLFSFNSPLGMCMDCHGLGQQHGFASSQIVVDEKKSIQRGALLLLPSLSKMGRWPRHILTGAAEAIEKIVGMDGGTLLKAKWKDLPEHAKHLWLYGTGDKHITFAWRTRGGVYKHGGVWEGWVNRLLNDYRTTKNPMRRKQLEKYMESLPCPNCEGGRLNRQARNVRLTSNSRRFKKRGEPMDLSLPQVCALSIEAAAEFFESLKLDPTQQLIAEEALKEVRGRLGFLLQCGLHYLALERSAPTLSGGESQRIRLAGQIGCGLVGVVYILDEPSIGLHPRDNTMLLESLQRLRDQGNTVIVVEHDEETMRAADHIVDFGPGPGNRGGELVAEGKLKDVLKNKRSVTGQYLSGKLTIEVPKERRGANGHQPQGASPGSRSRKNAAARKTGASALRLANCITVKNACHNNLKGIDVAFPLGRFICVTGVSGSGKSSLTNDILWQVLNRDVNQGKGEPGKHDRVNGLTKIDKAIDIDQSPIGRTPRSNPATYVKVFDEIRKLFTQLPQSKMRGYKPGRFSFNVSGGRCEACEGHGATKLEMDFLADIWIPCDVCAGRRFSHETLEVKFNDHSVADILELEIRDALKLFENVPKINRYLETLCLVGLDYMTLGQPSPTLSGGEAQRTKLSRELGKRSTGQTLYLLDEPTTGLHFADVHKLLEVLHSLVDLGNTVIVVEHNLDVIKTADWVIDMGPEGGEGGGRVVCEGTPEDVAKCKDSYTGAALRPVLGMKPRRSGKASRQRHGAAANGGAGTKADPFVFAKCIEINGASQHNLQHLDLQVPRGEMSVFCGPSGSGKTSLAMDTLYAEGQRRYVESLSAYARQFLGQMPKPRVDSIQGLSPAIAIEQKTVGATPRSTVGTVTEIYDYLRVLYARLGTVHCPQCGKPAQKQTTDEIVDAILRLDAGQPGHAQAVSESQVAYDLAGTDTMAAVPAKARPSGSGRQSTAAARALLLAPIAVDRQTTYESAFERLRANGWVRVRVDGTTYSLEAPPDIDHRRSHNVEIVADRIAINKSHRGRITDSVEAALDAGKGVIRVAVASGDVDETDWPVHTFSLHLSCFNCGQSFDHPSPQQFSFNSPLGWCWSCEGLGTEYGANQSLLVTSPERSLLDGAIGALPDPRANGPFRMLLEAIGAEFGIPLDQPWYLLNPEHQRVILYGDEDRWIEVKAEQERRNKAETQDNSSVILRPGSFRYRGLFPAIELAARLSYSHRRSLMEMAGEKDCSVCNGTRLEPVPAAVKLKHVTLPQLCRMPLAKALEFLKSLTPTKAQQQIAGDLLDEAVHRLNFLVEIGLEYLTMDRGMPTLSGGESQRIRLAGQVGRSLTGVLYVLDEPTIGLHPRDNGRLLAALKRLRDLGNTVLLVEHDREVLEAADRLYDFGPGAGRLGGTVVAEGTPKQIARLSNKSLTGGYLSGKQGIPVPEKRRVSAGAGRPKAPAAADGSKSEASSPGARQQKAKPAEQVPLGRRDLPWLCLLGASQHNLRNVDLSIPLGTLTCITGVSGSGKSSLIMNTLARAVARKLNLSTEAPGPFRELLGIEHLSKIVIVDQNPIGNTPASNPATYTGVFDHVRELFCRMPDAKVRGYRPGRFSFNRAGGRCEDCEGMGQQKIEMHFLPDVWVECPTCRGKRYNNETLGVKFNDHSIADVLDMPIEKALTLFSNVPRIRAPLATLNAIGLGYLTLGQSAPTLSGGEAQRIKLAAELAKPNQGRTLYLLDEPTTGLHFDDIAKLLAVLNSLVEQGNTVVVIEHNLDVIKTADWIVDLGPEAGSGGGMIVAEGTPEDVVEYAAAVGADGPTAHAAQSGSKAGIPLRSRRLTMTDSTPEAPSGRRDPPRSHTGELLAPVLAEARTGQIETFDVKAAAKQLAGDVSVEQLGKSAKLPWEVDGQKWHTRECLSHDGQRCQWDGRALQFVIDLLAKDKRLSPVNWNHRSTVEVKAKDGLGWFLHARTGHTWLMALSFRVRRKTFEARQLDFELNLTPIDDVEEILYYSQSERVRVRNMAGPWQEVTIKVWKKEEIDTPAFRRFLIQAAEAHVMQATKEKAKPDEVMPWKQLGRKWHLMKKGLPNNGRVDWEYRTLEKLLEVVEESLTDCDVDYGMRTKINFNRDSDGSAVAELQTKRRDGVDLALFVPRDSVTVGSIAQFGTRQVVKHHRSGGDAVTLRFTKAAQVNSELAKWIAGNVRT